MAMVTKSGAKIPSSAGHTPGGSAAMRQLMILTDRPALFDPDIAELAELARGLGFRLAIERFDLEENKFSSFVLE